MPEWIELTVNISGMPIAFPVAAITRVESLGPSRHHGSRVYAGAGYTDVRERYADILRLIGAQPTKPTAPAAADPK